jgi:hypothetical protein
MLKNKILPTIIFAFRNAAEDMSTLTPSEQYPKKLRRFVITFTFPWWLLYRSLIVVQFPTYKQLIFSCIFSLFQRFLMKCKCGVDASGF